MLRGMYTQPKRQILRQGKSDVLHDTKTLEHDNREHANGKLSLLQRLVTRLVTR